MGRSQFLDSFRVQGQKRQRRVGSRGHETEVSFSQLSSGLQTRCLVMDSFMMSDREAHSAVIVQDGTELGRVRL